MGRNVFQSMKNLQTPGIFFLFEKIAGFFKLREGGMGVPPCSLRRQRPEKKKNQDGEDVGSIFQKAHSKKKVTESPGARPRLSSAFP